jgi:hypothetical protein
VVSNLPKVLGQERAMTNVIPIRLRGEPLGPFPTIKELHALYEKLRHLKAETLLLDQKLSRDIQSIDRNAPARNAINQASTLVSSAADEILEAIAELIVETTANFIVPPAQHQDQTN